MALDGAPLWAMTAYFNPAGYRSRQENYRLFRRQFTRVPLVTVECSVDGRFQLNPGDADILMQVRGDVMWQKERLLNLALDLVPASASAVAWFDCDVLLERNDWDLAALVALKTVPVVQLYSMADWRVPDSRVRTDPQPANWRTRRRRVSLAAYYVSGQLGPEMRRAWKADDGHGLPLPDGYAWAARRGVLDRHRFFDRSILGGGTREFALAAIGDIETLHRSKVRTASEWSLVAEWAAGLADDVGGNVGYIDGTVTHLWHGSLADRRHGARHERFRRFGFDPLADVSAASGEAWTWATPKPEMHAFVRRYFDSRREDDPPHCEL